MKRKEVEEELEREKEDRGVSVCPIKNLVCIRNRIKRKNGKGKGDVL